LRRRDDEQLIDGLDDVLELQARSLLQDRQRPQVRFDAIELNVGHVASDGESRQWRVRRWRSSSVIRRS
jgi:hypothetical protein